MKFLVIIVSMGCSFVCCNVIDSRLKTLNIKEASGEIKNLMVNSPPNLFGVEGFSDLDLSLDSEEEKASLVRVPRSYKTEIISRVPRKVNFSIKDDKLREPVLNRAYDDSFGTYKKLEPVEENEPYRVPRSVDVDKGLYLDQLSNNGDKEINRVPRAVECAIEEDKLEDVSELNVGYDDSLGTFKKSEPMECSVEQDKLQRVPRSVGLENKDSLNPCLESRYKDNESNIRVPRAAECAIAENKLADVSELNIGYDDSLGTFKKSEPMECTVEQNLNRVTRSLDVKNNIRLPRTVECVIEDDKSEASKVKDQYDGSFSAFKKIEPLESAVEQNELLRVPRSSNVDEDNFWGDEDDSEEDEVAPRVLRRKFGLRNSMGAINSLSSVISSAKATADAIKSFKYRNSRMVPMQGTMGFNMGGNQPSAGLTPIALSAPYAYHAPPMAYHAPLAPASLSYHAPSLAYSPASIPYHTPMQPLPYSLPIYPEAHAYNAPMTYSAPIAYAAPMAYTFPITPIPAAPPRPSSNMFYTNMVAMGTGRSSDLSPKSLNPNIGTNFNSNVRSSNIPCNE